MVGIIVTISGKIQQTNQIAEWGASFTALDLHADLHAGHTTEKTLYIKVPTMVLRLSGTVYLRQILGISTYLNSTLY